MAPLTSLEREYPIIDSNFQEFCASNGIFSVEDFLFYDLYELVALAEQSSTAERLKQGLTKIISLIVDMHQPWSNGLELLKDAQQSKCILSTGCERIDEFLQGGLSEGHLTELVGPSSSGKTQICLQTASNVAKKYRGRVIFIDTGNSVSSKRIAQFVSRISDPTKVKGNRYLHDVMEKIVCHSVFDIFALFDVLHQLKINLSSEANFQVRLLVIDSISLLIAPILNGSGAHGHALMVSAGFLLKKLAHEHNLSVLVTNHMVGGEGGTTKPALGESWKTIPHVRLQLFRENESNIRRMSVLRHPRMASGKAVKFEII